MDIIKDYDFVYNKMRFLYSIGKPYSYHRSGESMYFKAGGVGYFCSTNKLSGGMPLDQIGFISMVSHHIHKNKAYEQVEPNYRNESDIQYFSFNKSIKEGSVINDCYSVDISKAYWSAAHKMGIIDDRIYLYGISTWKEGLDMGLITKERYKKAINKINKAGLKINKPDSLMVDKKVRLASLGSFAKVEEIYRFNGKIEKHVMDRKSPYPHIFFNCANVIYKLMEKCRIVAGSDFIFYWTDGVYVKGKEAADKVAGVINGKGYSYVVKPIDKISRTEISFISHEERDKPYFVSTRLNKKQIKKSEYEKIKQKTSKQN